jgi:transketolase
MRSAFIKALVEIAEKDARVLLLTGDLGYMAVEPFTEKFPDRFFNVGVAEQDLVGLATGLAEAGFTPFVYSIVPFAVLRPYEFIRNGPILHQLPVRIIGMGGGLEYGHNGATHYGLEDVGVLRIQPGITIVAPADHEQARSALLATSHLPGPVYYRLGKDDKTTVPGLQGKFEIGRVDTLRRGSDLLILTMGSVAIEAVRAAEALEEQGVSSTLLVISCLNPTPEADLIEGLTKFPLAMTVEAHYVVGGIGSLVAEIIAEQGLACRLVRCGVKDLPDGITGSLAYMLEKNGLSGPQLAARALEAMNRHTSTQGIK